MRSFQSGDNGITISFVTSQKFFSRKEYIVIIFDWNNGITEFSSGNNWILNISLFPLLFTLFLDKNAALKPVNVTLHIGLHAQAGRSGMQWRYNHVEQDPDIT